MIKYFLTFQEIIHIGWGWYSLDILLHVSVCGLVRKPVLTRLTFIDENTSFRLL